MLGFGIRILGFPWSIPIHPLCFRCKPSYIILDVRLFHITKHNIFNFNLHIYFLSLYHPSRITARFCPSETRKLLVKNKTHSLKYKRRRPKPAPYLCTHADGLLSMYIQGKASSDFIHIKIQIHDSLPLSFRLGLSYHPAMGVSRQNEFGIL